MISVIGAGPAGSFYSSLKAKSEDVLLFEEDSRIGRPVACTGILTDEIRKIIYKLPRDLVISKISTFKIVSPGGSSIYIDLKKKDLVIDRGAFDEFLFSKAVDAGAHIHMNERFLGYKKIHNGYLIKTDRSEYMTDMIVGCDGPNSTLARSAGILNERRFIQGFQVRAHYPGLEEGITTIYLNRGEFSWIVPEDERIARVGIVGANGRELHNSFKRLIRNAKIIEHQSGVIPLYDPHQALRKRQEEIYLLGDAATQVKATTYGGIIYALNAAKMLAKDAHHYEKDFDSTFGKELRLSLKARNLLNAMDDKQADTLIGIFQEEKNKKILSDIDRNYPSRMMPALLSQRRLWGLGASILKNRILHRKG